MPGSKYHVSSQLRKSVEAQEIEKIGDTKTLYEQTLITDNIHKIKVILERTQKM